MQINFTSHNLEISPALKELTLDKFSKLEHHFDKITAINILFNVEKLDQIAEATISIPNATLHAKANSEDMYKSIDELLDKIDKQLIKHKKKCDHIANKRIDPSHYVVCASVAPRQSNDLCRLCCTDKDDIKIGQAIAYLPQLDSDTACSIASGESRGT